MVHHVANGEHLGVSETVQSGSTVIRPCRSVSRSCRLGQRPGQRRRLHPGRPDDSSSADPLLSLLIFDDNTICVDLGHDAPHTQLHAEIAEGSRCPSREPVTEGSQGFRSGVEQKHAGGGGVDRPELVSQGSHRQLAELAGQLAAGGPRSYHHEGQPFPPLLRVDGQLRHLERAEDPATDLEGVVDRLHAGGMGGELVVAEIGEAVARGHDQAQCERRRIVAVGPAAVTTRPLRSKPVTSANTTSMLRWRDKTPRRGGAIWPSLRMPVAYW